MGLQKFGATATITGDYFEDHSRLWTESDEDVAGQETISSRTSSSQDDELVDAKKLVPDLSFISNKELLGRVPFREVSGRFPKRTSD